MSRFKTVVPLMVYLDPAERTKVKNYAKKEKTNVSQLAREAFRMRLAGGDDPFNQGFNHGLNEAIRIINITDGAKMAYPSGKTVAKLLTDEIENFLRETKDAKS